MIGCKISRASELLRNSDALYQLGEILVKDQIYWVIPYPFNPFVAISSSTWR